MTGSEEIAKTAHNGKKRKRRRVSFIERTISSLSRRMERAFYAEELAQADGLLQKITPPVKTAGLLLLLIDVALARNLYAIACAFIIALLLALLSRVPLRTLATRAWIGVLLFTGLIAFPAIFITPGRALWHLPIVGWPVTAQGLRSALYLIARVETAVTFSLLLILCTPWTHVLKSLSVLGVPTVFIVILGMTYRYIFLFLQITQDMFESRQSRAVGALAGAERRRLAAASAGVLLSKSYHLSSEVHLAMQSRGFRGEVYTLDDFEMRRLDWAALVAFLILIALLYWIGHHNFNFPPIIGLP